MQIIDWWTLPKVEPPPPKPVYFNDAGVVCNPTEWKVIGDPKLTVTLKVSQWNGYWGAAYSIVCRLGGYWGVGQPLTAYYFRHLSLEECLKESLRSALRIVEGNSPQDTKQVKQLRTLSEEIPNSVIQQING